MDRIVGMIANLNWRAYGMLLVLIVVGIIFQFSTDGIFLSPRNLALLFRQASILIIVASGVALLLLMGEVDLSIGSAVYLSGLAAPMAQVNWGIPTSIAVLVALGAGLTLGAWQGFWVIWLKVSSFVVTLAGLLAFRGLGYMWSNAATVAPMNNSFVNISEFFIPRSVSLVLISVTWLLVLTMTFRRWRTSRKQSALTRGGWTAMSGRVAGSAALAALLAYMAGGFLGIPMAVVVALGVTVILTVVAGNTRFGRHLYAIGGSRQAAYLSGININGSVLLVFLIMGLVYGSAGILAAARLNAVAPSTGNFLELEAISAAVIGGVSLSGGIGSVHGAVIGALLLTSIDNGLSLLNVSSFLQLVTKAQLLLFAVWFDVTTRNRSDPWIKHEISPRSYPHGIGAGDVNGDGRTDVITPKGWFEAPSEPRNGQWVFHPEFDLGATGFIYTEDLNGDGLPDLVTSLGHDYGIFWCEQKKDATGKRSWVKHLIDDGWSQSHAMTLVDLNGDGRRDLVTGKRYKAHEHDPGANEPLGVYWYEALQTAKGLQWKRHIIDYSTRAGGGIQIPVVDIDGDGDLDIIVAGRSGLFLFENLTQSR